MMRRAAKAALAVLVMISISADYLLGQDTEKKEARPKKAITRQKANSPETFVDWCFSVNDYLMATKDLIDRSKGLESAFKPKIDAALEAGSEVELGKAAFEINKEFDAVSAELEALKPPGELQKYHREEAKRQKNVRLALLAAIENDPKGASLYKMRALKAELDGMRELRRLYVKHNAPQETVEQVDRIIMAHMEGIE